MHLDQLERGQGLVLVQVADVLDGRRGALHLLADRGLPGGGGLAPEEGRTDAEDRDDDGRGGGEQRDVRPTGVLVGPLGRGPLGRRPLVRRRLGQGAVGYGRLGRRRLGSRGLGFHAQTVARGARRRLPFHRRRAPRPPEPALTRLSAEQVRTLAPDAAVARAGDALATPRRWSETGESGSAAWGLCQGSRATPYQVAIDLDGLAYSCSCPSRKNPCKHALGLLFLLAETPLPAGDATSTPELAQPRWAAEWLAGRAARATDANRPPVDPVAQARRIESRERKVAAGIGELDRWLGDLIRRGLDAARAGGYATWESMAARLVDAQAGGLARSVRGLGSMAGTIDAWPHLLLEGTARLHLLCEAYRRADELPAGLRADVRSLVGWTTREDDLGDADAEEDRWLVVGRRLDEGIQVMTARTWLLGEASGRIALHLAFGVDEAPPTPIAVPGRSFRATLAFYPSATPLRAVVRPVLVPAGEVDGLPPGAGESVEAMLGNHAERLATNPFLDSWPVLLAAAEPIPVQGGVVLRQAGSAESLPMAAGSTATRLLATSGGHPVAVFGEWDGSQLRPVSAFAEGRFVDLEPGDMASSPSRDGIPTWPAMLSAALLGDGAERSAARRHHERGRPAGRAG